MSFPDVQAFRKTQYTHRIGLFSAIPVATDVLTGTLYYAYDTKTLYRSNGTTWDVYSGINATDMQIIIDAALAFNASILRRLIFVERALGIYNSDFDDRISDAELIELNGGTNVS